MSISDPDCQPILAPARVAGQLVAAATLAVGRTVLAQQVSPRHVHPELPVLSHGRVPGVPRAGTARRTSHSSGPRQSPGPRGGMRILPVQGLRFSIASTNQKSLRGEEPDHPTRSPSTRSAPESTPEGGTHTAGAAVRWRGLRCMFRRCDRHDRGCDQTVTGETRMNIGCDR